MKNNKQLDIKISMSDERKSYNTNMRTDLMKRLRILAAELERRQNHLLEEAIQDLLEKYRSASDTENN